MGIAISTSTRFPVNPMNLFLDKFPSTVETAIEKLMVDMTFADRTRLANMNETTLAQFHSSYGVFIRTEFRLPGNEPLMKSCMAHAYMKVISAEQASYVILKELQNRLRSGHVLTIVK